MHAFAIKILFFELLGRSFFLRTCLCHRDQSALAPIGKYFCQKENRGDSCAGSGQTSLVFYFEAKLVFEKPPRAREDSLQKYQENTYNLPNNVILKNPFKREHGPDPSPSLSLGLH